MNRFLKQREHWRSTAGTRFGAAMRRLLEPVAEHADYVIGGDNAGEVVVIVHHGESKQVVFIKQFGDFFVVGSDVRRDQGFLRQREQRGRSGREHKVIARAASACS